jgi:hypothetical protein
VLLVLMTHRLARAGDEEWQVVKSKHFLVYHQSNAELATAVAREAEDLYVRICRDIGYTKFDDFWLWNDRAKITIYPSHAAFTAATQSPHWAGGRADAKTREIATFAGHASFLDTVLPHELTHLIFREFLGFADVPLWLSEGVAQWEETARRDTYVRAARRLARYGRLTPIARLTALTYRDLEDRAAARIVYAQAASLVGFLIGEHGSARFNRFCRQLRDGKSIDDALRFTYPRSLPNIGALETAWRRYLEDGS